MPLSATLSEVRATVIIFAILLGGTFGSYAGVVASRGWAGSLRGRSHCDACGRKLEWFELVPFLSFAALRGRCRTCGASFGWAPLLCELAGAAVVLAVALPITLLLPS